MVLQVKPFLGFCPSQGLILGAHEIYDSYVFLLGLRVVLKIGFRWKKISRIKKAHFSLNHPSTHVKVTGKPFRKYCLEQAEITDFKSSSSLFSGAQVRKSVLV